jgi:hypothetical protein
MGGRSAREQARARRTELTQTSLQCKLTGMTVPANASESTRLDELAAVTKEYATYSRTAYGFAFVVTGAALLGTQTLDVVTRSLWARLSYLLLAPVWLLLLTVARRYYQRHGEVVEREQRVIGRGWMLGCVYFVSAAEMFVLGSSYGRGSWPGPLPAMLATFGIVAIPVLAAEVVRGKIDAAVTLTLIFTSMFAAFPLVPAAKDGEIDSLDPAISIVRAGAMLTLSVFAIAIVVAGVRQHVRHRALQRRLGALNERA